MALILMGGSGQLGTGLQLFVDTSQDAELQAPATLELASSLPQSLSHEQEPVTPEIQDATLTSTLTSLANSTNAYEIDRGEEAASAASALFAQTALAAQAVGSRSEVPTVKEPGYGQGASFFGTYAAGQRFVFVIDSSQSMLEGTRWPTLRRELIRAIKGLSEDQEFYVISFDFGAHPMFNLYPPRGSFLPPTQESVNRLNGWLNSIQHGGATLPATSIGLALKLQPDAIFLLSDGEIQDNTVEELRFYNRHKEESGKFKVAIPIHTVLLHSPVGAATLKIIADENDGVFTPVTAFGPQP
jgi:hypothetical protein